MTKSTVLTKSCENLHFRCWSSDTFIIQPTSICKLKSNFIQVCNLIDSFSTQIKVKYLLKRGREREREGYVLLTMGTMNASWFILAVQLWDTWKSLLYIYSRRQGTWSNDILNWSSLIISFLKWFTVTAAVILSRVLWSFLSEQLWIWNMLEAKEHWRS